MKFNFSSARSSASAPQSPKISSPSAGPPATRMHDSRMARVMQPARAAIRLMASRMRRRRRKKPELKPRRTSNAAWVQLGGNQLETLLEPVAELGGAAPVRLVDARYLIEQARSGSKLLRRQDMPEHAFVPVDTLRNFSDGTGHSLRLLCVSHAWLQPDHPDPRGDNLRLLGAILAKYVEHHGKPDGSSTYGVFLDFCSCHQKGPHGEPRSRNEEALFRQALEHMGDWYSHPETIVLKCTQMPKGYPEGFAFPPGVVPNTADYRNRGWVRLPLRSAPNISLSLLPSLPLSSALSRAPLVAPPALCTADPEASPGRHPFPRSASRSRASRGW